jgi:hypothetical protein
MGQYSRCMSLQRDVRRHQNVIVRIVRWKPASYPQVWLVSAPFVASGILIAGLVAALSGGGFAADRFLLSLPSAVIAFVGQGAIESYRLGKRKDATVYQEWLEARDRSAARPHGTPVGAAGSNRGRGH